MAPRVLKEPPFRQVVNHYRRSIDDGTLKDNERLPPMRALMEEFDLSNATINKAIGVLKSMGYVRTSQAGTFVCAGQRRSLSPADRASAVNRTGLIYPPSQFAKVLVAELAPAPDDVADALGVEPGEQVIRRQRITYHQPTEEEGGGEPYPVTASTSWILGRYAENVPELLSTERIKGGTPGALRDKAGLRTEYWRVQKGAFRATEEEAELLNVEPGSPVTRGRNWYYTEDDEVVEFGQFVEPEGREQMFEGRV